MNKRENLLPNLWCFCYNSINPTIIYENYQKISFTITNNNISIGFVVIYASTCYIKRRHLWNRLNTLLDNHNIPWSMIGDFNTVLGAHEYRGAHSPARLPMADFSEWTNNNALIHLPIRGAFYTWANGRGGAVYTEKRLDRVICNQSWLDLCANISVSTLPKTTSDHFPLILEFHTSTNRFVSQFKFMNMWTMNDDCKRLIAESWNIPVVGCPMFILSQKLKRLKLTLKYWNKNVFGDANIKVNEVETNLQAIQDQIHASGATDLLNIQTKCSNEVR